MMSPSNAISDASVDSPIIVPAVARPTRPLYWSIRRELWENRSIYIAPLAAAAVVLFGFSIWLTGRLGFGTSPYDFAAGVLMVTQLLVGFFYCIDALNGERRDRSILFWKSLPVSDLTTVLSKAAIPILGLPLLTWAVTFVTQLLMLLLSIIVVGSPVATSWAQGSFLQMSLLLLYHLITVHGLWHAPFYGWLLMVSAWARRAVFLWAVLPPLAVLALEKIVFGTSHLGDMLIHRFAGGPEAIAMASGNMPIDPGTHLTPGHLLASPGLWIGLLITAAFLAAAVRLRRQRGPI
jgi:ABC-2 type transport system permease protein